MREAVLSDAQKALLRRYAEVGGCVDYVLLDCDPAADDLASAETHRRAAVMGLEIIRDRLAEYAAVTSRQEGIPIDKFFYVRIDYGRAASLVGTRLSREEFLGPRYDLERSRVVLPSSGAIPGGYAYAFSDPPYTLYDYATKRRVSEEEASELFHAINREVLGGLTPANESVAELRRSGRRPSRSKVGRAARWQVTPPVQERHSAGRPPCDRLTRRGSAGAVV